MSPNQLMRIAQDARSLFNFLQRCVINATFLCDQECTGRRSVSHCLYLDFYCVSVVASKASRRSCGALNSKTQLGLGRPTMHGRQAATCDTEVSESRLSHDQRIALEVLTRLRLKRFRISIDRRFRHEALLAGAIARHSVRRIEDRPRVRARRVVQRNGARYFRYECDPC